MSEDAHSGTVELDVMVTAQVPMPSAYVFRAEGANRLSRLVAGLRPGGEVVRAPCLVYAVHHPSAGTILKTPACTLAPGSACARTSEGR